ncbi:hypothetical protein T07_9947 [Trichinella nelsoni]|uniref:Uncharacterized protein n=1 Tax=Trichinella nelsoni TaxID=6336 RepID=A0A0V0SDG6_9BILA|nr:hypothetical protein T07_9947 [Trichinella nelsoni]
MVASASAARLLLYSYVQRNQWVVSVQWNYFYKLEYLSLMVVQVSLNGLKRCTKILYVNIIETFWNSYCSFQHGMSRILQCVLNVPSQNKYTGLNHQHRARSYSCVSLGWLNGVTQYWSRNLCGFAYRRSAI